MIEKPKRLVYGLIVVGAAGALALRLLHSEERAPHPEVQPVANFDQHMARHVGSFTAAGYIEGGYSGYSVGDCSTDPESWSIQYVSKGRDYRLIAGITDGRYEPDPQVYPDGSTSNDRAPIITDGVAIDARGNQVTMTPLYGEPVVANREEAGLRQFTTGSGNLVRYGQVNHNDPPTGEDPSFAVQISCQPEFPNQPIDNTLRY